MPNHEILPIKIVKPNADNYKKLIINGRGAPKVFGEVTPDIRANLITQIEEVKEYFDESFTENPNLPAVGKVQLKSAALAKSHRPTELLNDATCPIIGAGTLGELFVSVDLNGLKRLSDKIQDVETKVGVANISTIQEIKPFTVNDAICMGDYDSMVKEVEDGNCLKLKLFYRNDAQLDHLLHQALLRRARELGIVKVDQINYGNNMQIFSIKVIEPYSLMHLAGFIGTQSLSAFPKYNIINTQAVVIGNITIDTFPAPDADTEYPVIGLVDSGIDPANQYLAPWITAREEYVSPGDRDYEHGSFVAGLAIHARKLNGSTQFPDTPSKIVDVQVIPRIGAKGVTEPKLLAILEEAINKYRYVKVWNLSLGIEKPCEEESFSDIAVAFDRLQDMYDVTFVIAAGNLDRLPLRGWPSDIIGDRDRITPPADSVRALSVGSLAHLAKPSSIVRENQPSPFSRRGPGPVFIPKPELVHFGGNCDAAAIFHQTGVLSINADGELAEDIGTSFSTPLVSTLLANIEAAIRPASRSLVKALLIHSAVLSSPEKSAEDLKFFGFGVPGVFDSAVSCNPWTATMIFESDIVPGFEYEHWPLPIPACLRGNNDAVCGEILITAVYEPPLDKSFGAEYCRTNVEISLGTYDQGKKGKREHKKKIPNEPGDISELYESALVEHGFKWSPVKVFRRHLHGVQGRDWRLKVTVTHRNEYIDDAPQKFALVITLRDPEKRRPVYDEVITAMQQLGWSTVDLKVRDRIRATT